MRFATAVAVLALGGCAGGPAVPSPTPTVGFDWGGAMTEAFTAANAGAPWFSEVRSLTVEGKAVVVTSSLAEDDRAAALEMCAAASTVAQVSGQGYTSVAVRTADGTTLAHRDDPDTACRT